MQELQDDFGICPSGNNRFNSTVIDEDPAEEDDDYRMEDDDGVEISPTRSSSHTNEKCLLDELLQTEEVKKTAVYSVCNRLKSTGRICINR